MAGNTIGGGYATCRDKGCMAAVKAASARQQGKERAAAERARAAASWWRPKGRHPEQQQET